jgi:hypothetical protein
MLPSAVNDTMRDMMAQIRDVGDGIRDGTYTMTAPVITGGSITGVALSGNTFTNPVITGGSINNTPIGASTANTGAFTTLSASGVATFSAGTVSAPAITTSGDTNTGIFFPAADTIAFTEGGVEAMRIDSSGNVGIGTSSINAQTKVAIAGANQITDARGILSVNSTNAAATNLGGSISFGGENGQATSPYVFGSVAGRYAGSGYAGYLQFSTTDSGATVTERMRIDSSGNVGIGTSSNSYTASGRGNLNIAGSSSAILGFQIGGSAKGYYFHNGTDLQMWNEVAGAAVFATNALERMRIDSSGNVGIGTSSPASPLEITRNTTGGSSGEYPNIRLNNISTAGYTGLYFMQSNTQKAGFEMKNDVGALQVFTGTTERMRITSGGDLLVGTTTVIGNERLNVTKDANAQELIRFNATNSSAPWGVDLQYSAAAPNGTSNLFFGCRDTGGARFNVRSNGGLANYSANNVNLSDAREKTNIELAGSYLDKICAIPVKTFNYIDQNRETDDGLTLGVIAQDVEVVAPELVMESNWGTKEEPKMRLSIYQTDLQYALMKSIQELKAIVDAQAAEIALLKSK